MLRNTWTFSYTAEALLTAVDRKIEHHTERLTHWLYERDVAAAAVKQSAEVREHEVTGGQMLNVVLDPEKQRWHMETQAKVDAHQKQLDDFRRWHVAFEAQPFAAQLQLHPDDIEYFGLGDGD